MSLRSVLIALLIITTIIVAFPQSGAATTVVRLSLADLTAASSAVVHGSVVSTGSRWNETRSMIVTDVQVRVMDAVKGQAGGEITITQLGGEIGVLKTEVPGASAFRRGEEAVLFLASDGRGGFHVTGLSQGRFEVVEDARRGGKILRGMDAERLRGLRSVTPAGAGRTPGSLPSLAAPDGRVSLDRFLNRVRDLMENAGEGGGR